MQQHEQQQQCADVVGLPFVPFASKQGQLKQEQEQEIARLALGGTTSSSRRGRQQKLDQGWAGVQEELWDAPPCPWNSTHWGGGWRHRCSNNNETAAVQGACGLTRTAVGPGRGRSSGASKPEAEGGLVGGWC